MAKSAGEDKASNTSSQSRDDETPQDGLMISAGSQHLHRKLRGREVQLFAVGGAIGTSLFVQMGAVLPKGGPAGLFLGFIVYGTVILCVNQCFAEMVCYLPIPCPYVRLASHWVDEAFGLAMGYNFFLNMALGIPYEIVAINVLLTYWTDEVPVAAVVAACIVLYAGLNILTVRYFGISEFYLSIFKIFLMLALMLYTFITMLGGNPQGDRYGFRYWNDPGAFVSYLVPGDAGRFCGLLACMIQASFTMVGPEYISMAAAEAERPRSVMGKAYSAFVWRLMFFFLGGALCMGIVLPYDDPTLKARLESGSGTGAASPYVISMTNFRIRGVPSLVNALIMTSVFSAGNNLVFSGSRLLYGMALDGQAPSILAHCNKRGLPYIAVGVTMVFSALGFLQVSSSSAQVLDWLVSVLTASYLLNYFGTCITYLHFHASLRRNGIDRAALPYKGRLPQPFAAWYAVFGTGIMTLVLGFDLFFPGHWELAGFFLNYTMIGFFIVCFVTWKVFKRTKYVWPGTADLSFNGLKQEIDAYEEGYVPPVRGRISRVLNSYFE